jgi:hypothetical protein
LYEEKGDIRIISLTKGSFSILWKIKCEQVLKLYSGLFSDWISPKIMWILLELNI